MKHIWGLFHKILRIRKLQIHHLQPDFGHNFFTLIRKNSLIYSPLAINYAENVLWHRSRSKEITRGKIDYKENMRKESY